MLGEASRAAPPEPPSWLPTSAGRHGDPQQPDPHQLQLVAHLGAGERCGQAGGCPRRARGCQPRPLAQGEPGSVPLDPVLQLSEGRASVRGLRVGAPTRWPWLLGLGLLPSGAWPWVGPRSPLPPQFQGHPFCPIPVPTPKGAGAEGPVQRQRHGRCCCEGGREGRGCWGKG